MANKIITYSATDEYRAGHDRIFGKQSLCEQSVENFLVELAQMPENQRSQYFINPTTAWFVTP